MEPEDEIRVVAFSGSATPLGRFGRMRDVGESTINKVRGLFAEGNTALYDAVTLALDEIEKERKSRSEGRLYGIVVLSDGKDTSSTVKRLDLMGRLPKSEDTDGIKIFTIAYGGEADLDLLKEISDRTNAVSLKGEEKNIVKVYESISSYF